MFVTEFEAVRRYSISEYSLKAAEETGCMPGRCQGKRWAVRTTGEPPAMVLISPGASFHGRCSSQRCLVDKSNSLITLASHC